MRERHVLVSRNIVPQTCLWEVCEIPHNRSIMVLRVHGELAMLTKGFKYILVTEWYTTYFVPKPKTNLEK